jgi:mannose-1-phosphate guanylyltransferase
VKAALVLAAGFGTRLRPYTEYMPKPLLPVAGIEPLFFALWRAQCLGVKKFYVNAHYHHGQINMFLKNVAEPVLGISVEMLHENPILGTGGAIRNLLQKTEAGDFDELVVINGDTLLGLGELEQLDSPQASWCLVTPDQNFLAKYKPLWVNAEGGYAGVGEITHPEAGWEPTHFFGMHALKADALAHLREDSSPVTESDLFRGIYRPLLDAGFEIQAIRHSLSSEEFWYDMTNKDFLLEAQGELLGTIAGDTSCWKAALEARWGQEPKLMGKSWLLGVDPGCVNWSKSRGSIVVSPQTLKCEGKVDLDASVLILEGQDRSLGRRLVRNSLLMSASPKSAIAADSNLENEIIFL